MRVWFETVSRKAQVSQHVPKSREMSDHDLPCPKCSNIYTCVERLNGPKCAKAGLKTLLQIVSNAFRMFPAIVKHLSWTRVKNICSLSLVVAVGQSPWTSRAPSMDFTKLKASARGVNCSANDLPKILCFVGLALSKA